MAQGSMEPSSLHDEMAMQFCPDPPSHDPRGGHCPSNIDRGGHYITHVIVSMQHLMVVFKTCHKKHYFRKAIRFHSFEKENANTSISHTMLPLGLNHLMLLDTYSAKSDVLTQFHQ